MPGHVSHYVAAHSSNQGRYLRQSTVAKHIYQKKKKKKVLFYFSIEKLHFRNTQRKTY